MTFYIPRPEDTRDPRTPVRIVTCPHCGSTATTVRTSRGGIKVLACGDCGGTWKDTAPTRRVLIAPLTADRSFTDDDRGE